MGNIESRGGLDNTSTVSVLEHEEYRLHVGTRRRIYFFVKRCFDFLSSLCASIILLIPMGLIALLIMVRDPGNPFFMHKRVGMNGKEIDVLKFRSMRKNADRLESMLNPEQIAQYKKEYKLDDDPRLIGYHKAGDGDKCLGAFLRRTSLDELPQIIWNICIMGNMSVVGPRPILQEELQGNYSSEEQKMLLSFKPGLTGYWQAYARNNATYETGKRQAMELHYVRNASIRLDVKILFATVGAVISKKGAQ